MDEQIFKEFMKRRFPHERDESYIEEWRERFWSGRPEIYMDRQSLKIYKDLKRKHSHEYIVESDIPEFMKLSKREYPLDEQ